MKRVYRIIHDEVEGVYYPEVQKSFLGIKYWSRNVLYKISGRSGNLYYDTLGTNSQQAAEKMIYSAEESFEKINKEKERIAKAEKNKVVWTSEKTRLENL